MDDVGPSKEALTPSAPGWTLHIGGLMLVIALVALCLAAAQVNVGTGIFLGVMLALALLRTSLASRRRDPDSPPMSSLERLVHFAVSFGLLIAVLVAAGAAFFVTCTGTMFIAVPPQNRPYANFEYAFVVGAVTFLIALIPLLRRYFRRRPVDATTRLHLPGNDPEPLPRLPEPGPRQDPGPR